MFLRNPFIGAFGLDIGDLSLKLIQLKRQHTLSKKPNYEVAEARTVTLSPGYIVDGEIQQPEMVRKKILQLLGREGTKYKPLKIPWVVTGLPEPKTFLKTITVDISPQEITGDDILYQARKHLPFDLNDAYLDWQITNSSSSTEDTSQVIIGAVPKVIADSYTYLLESADLQPIALEIEAAASARALITADKEYTNEARAILDLGATRSSLVIYDKNNLQFSINLNFSGELVTTALSQKLKLEYAEAEKEKIAYGLTYNKDKPHYLATITNLTDKLMDEIKMAINFYKEHFTHTNPITHITMTGGMSNLKNLDTTIARKLKISAKPGNAWKNLGTCQLNKHWGKNGTIYSSAIGLALRAAQKPW